MSAASPGVSNRSQFWPYRQDLESLAVRTPITALDLTGLREVVVRIGKWQSRRSVAWRPAGVSPLVAPAVAVLGSAGVTGLTVPGLSDAERAVVVGAPALTVLIPPVVGEGPERLSQLARTKPIRIVCDHFAQVERLAASLHAAGTDAELLLRIDPGRERLGVRPGPDLKDLAQGVSQLPGVRLVGIFVEDRTITACGVSGLSPRELADLLGGCRASLERLLHIELPIVSVGRLRDIDRKATDSPVTEVRTPLPRNAGGSLAIVAGVVGRPTREQAILDVGRRFLGRAAVALLPGGAEIHPVAIDEDFTVLRLAGSARDLAIGDVVTMKPAGAARMPQKQWLLVRDGGDWRLASCEEGLPA